MQSAQLLKENQQKLSMLQTTIENNQAVITLLKQKQESLGKINNDMEERENIVKKLEEEKRQLQQWLFEQSESYKKIQQFRAEKGKVLNPNERLKLKNTIFNIYATYVEEIRRKYPRLVEDDLLLLCLQKTELDSKAIAICFGYEDTHAINQRKVRIKERMKATEAKV